MLACGSGKFRAAPFSLSIFASTPVLVSGRSPYKGTREGERGSSLRAVAALQESHSVQRLTLPVASPVWKREAQALCFHSRNS